MAGTDLAEQFTEGGPDYIYALLTGYVDPPEGVVVGEGMNYNKAEFMMGVMPGLKAFTAKSGCGWQRSPRPARSWVLKAAPD